MKIALFDFLFYSIVIICGGIITVDLLASVVAFEVFATAVVDVTVAAAAATAATG